MKNYNMILIERLQKYLLASSSGMYEYLPGEDILPSNQQKIIEQAKFTYSPLGKAFKTKQKQLKIREKNK